MEDDAGSETVMSKESVKNCASVSAVPESLSRDYVVPASLVNSELGKSKRFPEILGVFDKAVTVVKESKKRRPKNSIFWNLAEVGGSLHNRAVRKATKFKYAGHRRTVSLSNNAASVINAVVDSTDSRGCQSEGRDAASQNSEVSLICKSNRRQWCIFDRDSGSKVWNAIESLGVVHNGKEEAIFAKIEKLENHAVLRKSRVKESKVSSL